MTKKALSFLIPFAMIMLPAASAFAQGGLVAADNAFSMYSMFAVASGFGIAIAALGGALGQGRAAAAALEGIARNPNAAGKLQTPLILSLALIESLVIYALVITILITLQIDAKALIAAMPK